MILTLIFITMLILGIAGLVVYDRCNWAPELFDLAGLPLTIVGGMMTGISIILIVVNLAVLNIDYDNKLAERQMLEYRIENYENAVGNELIYADVLEFNNDLRTTKRYADSPWTSWYHNWKIADIDYVDITKIEQKGK